MPTGGGREATLEWLGRLIAEPTIAGRSNERLVNDVATHLTDRGAAVTVRPGARDDGLNLFAVLGPEGVDGGVMVAGHTDVVDVEGQPWSRDPFTLHLEAGQAYGRGTADMKGFLAVVLGALDNVEVRRLRRPLWLALTSDEELGCVGVRPLLDELAPLPIRPDWVLVGEPTELGVVDRHKGKAALRIELHGQAGHSSAPHRGANAVAYAGRLIVALLDTQREITAGAGDPSFEVPHSTLGIGPIRGGVALNVIPDRCRLDVEIRTIPADRPAERAQEIAAVCQGIERELQREHPAGRIVITELSGYPGLAAGAGPEVDRAITAVCGSPERRAVNFGTEGGLYRERLGVPVVVCGPGSIAAAHRADESVALAQLDGCRRMLDRILAGLIRAG